MDSARRVIVLGATGSIGRQTLDVIEHLNGLPASERGCGVFEVVGLASGSAGSALLEVASRCGARELAIASVGDGFDVPSGVNLRCGDDAAERLVREVEAEVVVSAIVGAAGLGATLAAAELGREVALANKEALVAAGCLVVAACASGGGVLLPVDSEHSGLWSCLSSGPDGFRRPPHGCPSGLRRAVLTASGGALRDWSAEALAGAGVEDALAHPNWRMGPKVTVDTATLVNKSFELIEAHWLFGIPGDRLSMVVHPQSVVHAVAEFEDGVSVAQLGAPDMRTPILGALMMPFRPPGVVGSLSLVEAGELTFREADAGRFPCVGLGHAIMERGGTAGAVANGANEAAVSAFLSGAVSFPAIGSLVFGALDSVGVSEVRDLADVVEADREGCACVERELRGEGAGVRGAADA